MKAHTLYTRLRGMRRSLRALRRRLLPTAFVAEVYEPDASRVLCLAPHPDDEVIGCGGALLLHARAGAQVTVALLNLGEKSVGFAELDPEERGARRLAESRASGEILGISRLECLGGRNNEKTAAEEQERLCELLEEVRPQLVYLPFFWDNQPDHYEINPLFFRAARAAGLPDDVVVHAYEIWTPCPASRMVDVSGVFEEKLRALRCHVTALDAVDYTLSVEGLARYRAISMRGGGSHAEGFYHAPWRDYAALLD